MLFPLYTGTEVDDEQANKEHEQLRSRSCLLDHLLSVRVLDDSSSDPSQSQSQSSSTAASAEPPVSARNSLTTAELVANLKTFLVAGADTVGSTIAWIIYYTALMPAVQKNMHDEIKAVTGASASAGAPSSETTGEQFASATSCHLRAPCFLRSGLVMISFCD